MSLHPTRVLRLLPVVVELFGLVVTLQLQVHETTGTEVDARAWLLGLGGVAGLVLAARWAYLGGAIVLGSFAGYAVLGYPGGPIYLALPLAMLLLAFRVSWQSAAAAAAVAVVVMTTAHVVDGGEVLAPSAGVLAWLTVAVLGAHVVRGRRARMAAERRHAEDERRRARVEERVRIAQDLHDGVGHALSVIGIQARVARRDVADGTRAAEALDAVLETSRTALVDIGAVLEGLRDRDAPLQPQPGLDDIESLVAQARASGQEVALSFDAEDAVPTSVQSAATRVVQEALTNARKHAPEAAVSVTVRSDDDLEVTISNPVTRASRADGHRLGLIGMQERVRSTGGSLETGRAGDEWVVAATWRL